MYRRDGSCKKAMVSMTADYILRGYKFPDGEIKDKYKVHILNIKDSCFKYDSKMPIW